MAKKKKRRIQAPSLSYTDKGIYYLLIVCSFIVGLFLYPAIIGNFRNYVFQNTRILAQSNPAAVILCFFGIMLGAVLALLTDWLRRKKQPIFGKTNITYGPPQWKPIYPVVSKQFWRNALNNKKRLFIAIAALILIVVIILIVTLLGLPPRECLLDDGSVLVYNSFNENTVSYDASDVAQIRIYTREFYDRRGPDDWAIEMEITMYNGEEFFFSYNDFKTRDENIQGSIAGMYQIKACFDPSIVMLEGKEDIQNVIRDMNLNQKEIELLYLLFEVDEPS